MQRIARVTSKNSNILNKKASSKKGISHIPAGKYGKRLPKKPLQTKGGQGRIAVSIEHYEAKIHEQNALE